MPYQTGFATDPNDLLQKIVAWLQTIGWTVNMSQANGTGWRAHVSKNGMFVNLCTTIGNNNPWGHNWSPAPGATVAGMHLYTGDGYSAGANWNLQPGGPKGNGQTYTVGASARLHQGQISSYGFYSDASDNICIVFEGQPGIISSIGWGRLNKAGVYTGGEYFFGSVPAYSLGGTSPNSPGITDHAYCPCANGGISNCAMYFIKADVDTFTGKWLSSGTTTTVPQGYTGRIAASSVPGNNTPPVDIASYIGLVNRATTEATHAASLWPINLWTPRDANIGGYSLLGCLPSIFYSNAAGSTNLNIPIGSEIQSGSDVYVLYPNFAVKKVA